MIVVILMMPLFCRIKVRITGSRSVGGWIIGRMIAVVAVANTQTIQRQLLVRHGKAD